MSSLRRSNLIHRKKRVIGGKVCYTQYKWRGGKMCQIAPKKHQGRTRMRFTGCDQSTSCGKAQTQKAPKSIQSSILKSLRRGGSICRY